MSDKPQDGILARIRKILSRTEQAGCTPAEAEAAFATASRLMAEHNLTMDQVSVTTTGESDSWVQEDVEEMTKWTLEDNLCYGILKRYYFVEAVLDRTGRTKTLRLFGKPENVQVARFVWESLHRSFDHCWMVYRIIRKAPASERRLFVSGMAKGFTQRLGDEREAQKIERDLVNGGSGSTALALASIHNKLAVAFGEHYGKMKKNSTNFAAVKGNQSTLEAGIAAGRALNLTKQVQGPRRKAIE